MKNVLRTIEETEGGGLADTVKKIFLLSDTLARYNTVNAHVYKVTPIGKPHPQYLEAQIKKNETKFFKL